MEADTVVRAGGGAGAVGAELAGGRVQAEEAMGGERQQEGVAVEGLHVLEGFGLGGGSAAERDGGVGADREVAGFGFEGDAAQSPVDEREQGGRGGGELNLFAGGDGAWRGFGDVDGVEVGVAGGGAGLGVEGEQRIADTLEGGERVDHGVGLADGGEGYAVGAVGEGGGVGDEVAGGAEPKAGMRDGPADGPGGDVVEEGKGEALGGAFDGESGVGAVEEGEAGGVAGLEAGGVEHGGDCRARADGALGERIAGAPEVRGGQGVEAQEAFARGERPLGVDGGVVPLPDGLEGGL